MARRAGSSTGTFATRTKPRVYRFVVARMELLWRLGPYDVPKGQRSGSKAQ